MKSVAWLIPSHVAGSGGIRTALVNAKALEALGHSTTIYTNQPHLSPAEARDRFAELYGVDFADVRPSWLSLNEHGAWVATLWTTAQRLSSLPAGARRLYFIQDFEPWHYPVNSASLAAEWTYRQAFDCITIGRFLAHKLAAEYGKTAAYVDFGVDAAVYRPLPDAGGEKSVCFVFQPDKARRCAELGIAALHMLRRIRPEVRIRLFGLAEDVALPLPESSEQLGFLSREECNALYNRSTVGFCLSATNPSRMPFEMMAAGLPVVDLWGPNTRYDFPDRSALLALPAPEALAQALVLVLDSELLRKRMRENGLALVRNRSQEDERARFARIASALIQGEPFAPQSRPDTIYTLPPVGDPKFNVRLFV